MIELPSVPLAASLNLANSTVNRLTNVFTADLDLSLISRKANLSKLSGFFFVGQQTSLVGLLPLQRQRQRRAAETRQQFDPIFR